MTLFQKLWTAIRSGFWSKPSEVREPSKAFLQIHAGLQDALDYAEGRADWAKDAFYEDKPVSVDPRTTELRLLDSQIERLANMIRRAKKNKKKWLPMNAKLKQLQDRRAKLSGTL